MFQTFFDYLNRIFSPILPDWGNNKRRREEDVYLIDDDDPPVKRARMNTSSESTGSKYFPSSFFGKKTKENSSQTIECIDVESPVVSVVSLLDENSSNSDEESVKVIKPAVPKTKSPKNKYRAPNHCRSPPKSKFKHVSSRRSFNDVQFTGMYSKNSPDSTDLISSNNSKRPIIKRISPSFIRSRNPRTEHIMSLAMRNQESFRSSAIIDFQSRMKYGELLGKVLKSPEMFSSPPTPLPITTNAKVIDLTLDEPSTSKSESVASTSVKAPNAFVDLTSPTKSSTRTADVIDLDSDIENAVPIGTFIPHRKIVSPINTLSTKLKHIPCSNNDFVSNIVAEIGQYKKEWTRDREVLNKALSSMSPLRKTFENALEERVRRHLRITSIDLDEEEEDAEPLKPQLTEQMISAVMNAWDPRKPKGVVLVNNFNYQIKRTDLQTLSGLNWLNDEVINFYMELISDRGKQKDFPSVHTFSTFFYPKLEKDGYLSLKRWTRKVDIFSFDLIVVPIHLKVHWCLAIINFKKKNISYFDSMGQANNTCVNSLLKYLADEHMDKKKEPYDTTEWDLVCTKDTVPQQMNSCDCGVFACTFAEYSTREAKFNFCQEDMPYFRKKMTYEILSSRILHWN